MMGKTEVFLPSIDGSYEEPFLVLEQIDYNKFLFMCNGTINSLALLYYQIDIDYCNLSFDIYMENNIVINEIAYPSSNEMLGLEEAKCASKYDSECSHIKIANIIINQDTFNNFFNTTDKYRYFDTKYTLCCGKYS